MRTFYRFYKSYFMFLFCAVTATTGMAQTCPAPYDLWSAQVGATSANLNFSGGEAGASYEIQYKPISSTAPYSSYTLVTATGTGGKSTTLTDLLPNTIYTWRVRTICLSGSTSGFVSPNNNFQTACPPPYDLWSAQVRATSANLNFSGGESGASYEIEYKPISSTAPYTSYTLVTAMGTGLKSYYLTDLTPNTIYTWRIRTICTSGSPSAFVSPGNNFQTTCALPSDLGTGQVGSTSARLSFYGGELSATYEIQYKPISSTAPFTSYTLVTAAGTGEKAYTPTDLIPNTIYTWKVRTICAPGITSAFVTAGSNFQTLCRIPSSPGVDQITNNSARVFWYNGETGADYEVQWRIRNTASWTSATLVTPLGVAAQKSFVINDIRPGTIYEWRVRSICAPGITSDFMVDPNSFQTLCGTPNSLTADQLTSTSARLNWFGGEAGASYEIDYRVSGATAWTTIPVSATQGPGEFKRRIVTGLNAGTVYEWRVRTVCTAGIFSVYAVPSSVFTTVCNPPAPQGVQNLQGSSVEVVWNAGESGASYEVQYRGVGTLAWTTATLSSTLPASESKRLTLNGLMPGVVYEWQIRTVCPSGVPSSFTMATQRFQVPVRNVYVGVGAGQSNNTGIGNVGLGIMASFSATNANSNVAVGDSAGLSNLGNNNTFVGARTSAVQPNLTNATAIGFKAKVGISNAIVLGDTTQNTKVGIGTTTPLFPLDVRGTINLRDRGTLKFSHLVNPQFRSDGTDKFLTVNEAGEVVLSRYRLSITDHSQWADRVFEPSYLLKPLPEVEQFIRSHQHLPGIPSARDIVKNGMDATHMNALLLEKIEELTLHLIQLQKEVNKLKTKK